MKTKEKYPKQNNSSHAISVFFLWHQCLYAPPKISNILSLAFTSCNTSRDAVKYLFFWNINVQRFKSIYLCLRTYIIKNKVCQKFLDQTISLNQIFLMTKRLSSKLIENHTYISNEYRNFGVLNPIRSWFCECLFFLNQIRRRCSSLSWIYWGGFQVIICALIFSLALYSNVFHRLLS